MNISSSRNVLLLILALHCCVQGFDSLSPATRAASLPSAAKPGRPLQWVPLQAMLEGETNDDDDDGWESNPSKESQLQELQALKQQQKSKATSTFSTATTTPTDEPERDLFIPIFALVSLAGLFGAYGYEMLRLYSRGELYLPF